MSRTKGSLNKHKKEKPVKEKKKRGRPSKQHQQQKQKQIVNVNVNGGGGGGSRNTTIPVPFQLPSTIYDPSLIAPHYGINDRQPVNPLTDAATDLMTPFIQSLISNQQKVNRIPISEGDVKPVNPINPKTPTQAIPIPQDDVKPVNPVIPKPVEQYVPNPQTDQSRPIPPEIIMDSNISSLIHNKHMQHKNLQNQIKPQVPKIPKIPKIQINDTEGLGKRIPIENIEALAGTIGTAALTGGASAAGEALLMGGTAGLMGAGETILGAGIGSGVATGTSMALGNSNVGNFISGVVGGAVGRAAGRAATNRRTRQQTTTDEQTPLLGNRLGGSYGRSRLVFPQEQTRGPTTGNNTSWAIPEQPSPQSTMDILKKVVNKKIKNINDGINNISQQITGRNKTPQKGTYAQVPSVDEYIPISETNKQATNNYKPIGGTNAIIPERPLLKLKQLPKTDKTAYHELGKLEYNKQLFEQNLKRAIDEPENATIRKDRRDQYKGLINSGGIQEAAARRENRRIKATTIQKVVRGHKLRKQLPEIMEEVDRQAIIDKINQVEQRANRIDKAAITIQKRFRQNKRKTTPITISNEPPTSTIQPANLIADNVSRNIVKKSMNNIIRKQQTAAAATLQSAMRRKTDMMKKRQLVDEEQLKQMEETQREIQAAKADKEKKQDIAAKQLQAVSKRMKAQSDVSKIYQAKDKIGAATKRLLTEKVLSFYGPKGKRTYIVNKTTAGQPLVVNKKSKLVSKKRHDAGVSGYETRQEYLDLAEKYKPIMTKGQKTK